MRRKEVRKTIVQHLLKYVLASAPDELYSKEGGGLLTDREKDIIAGARYDVICQLRKLGDT